MIRTIIPELKKAIEDSMAAVASYSLRPGLLECEDYLYSVEEHKIRMECLAELQKAKLIMKQRNLWQRILN
jgi:hypothetical protein